MMATLADIQRQMARHVRQGDASAHDLIHETAAVSRATRLRIYSYAYLARLDEAMRSNYPKLHGVLGDEDFFALVEGYFSAHPSRHRSIRWVGHELAAHMRITAPFDDVPMLAELADFEWALCHAFDAADEAALAADALLTIQDDEWAGLQPKLHPCLQTRTLHWNAIPVWRAMDQNQEPPRPTEEPGHWAVWRQELSPHYRSVPDAEWALLQAIQTGKPFAQACEALLPWHTEDDAPSVAVGLLTQWLRDGWITRLG